MISKENLTSEMILERLEYDRDNGNLIRRPGFTGVKAGSVLGSKDSNGKLQATFLGTRYMVSHLIWFLEHQTWPLNILYINGDTTDNRIKNLEEGRKKCVHSVGNPERIELFYLRHGDKYDYALVDLETKREEKVVIICGQHGPFHQKNGRHLEGGGCFACGSNQKYFTTEERRLAKNRREKMYKDKDPEKTREIVRKSYKRWVQKNKGKPEYEVRHMCHDSLHRVIRAITKKTGYRTKKPSRMDYTFKDLKHHLEKQFEDWMHWGNHGDWHVDHIKPVSAFLREGCYDVNKINALENLRPISKEENLKKKDKYVA